MARPQVETNQQNQSTIRQRKEVSNGSTTMDHEVQITDDEIKGEGQ
jgi:hypothetical protein